jgi:hypothetical protein
MKYKLIDIEDETSNEWSEPVTKEEALEQIQEWNDEMGTNYNSITEFNEKEQYWKWEETGENFDIEDSETELEYQPYEMIQPNETYDEFGVNTKNSFNTPPKQ